MARNNMAAGNGHLKVVKFLHMNRTEGCDTALIFATENCHFEVVKYLIENGLFICSKKITC